MSGRKRKKSLIWTDRIRKEEFKMSIKMMKRLSVLLVFALVFTLIPAGIVMAAKKKAKKVTFTVENSDFGKNVQLVSNNGKYGLADKKGKIILPISYDEITELGGGSYQAKKGDKVQLINSKGKQLVKGTYDYIEKVYNGKKIKGYIIRKGEKSGFFSNKGKKLLPISYESVEHIDGTELVVYSNGYYSKYGLINVRGKKILKFEYEYIYWYLNKVGLVSVKKNGKYGFLDKKGKMIVKPIYEELIDDIPGEKLAVKKDGKWGYIDKKGKVLGKLDYDLIYTGYGNDSDGSLSKTVYGQTKNGETTIYSIDDGSQIGTFKGDEITRYYNNGENIVLRVGDNYSIIKKSGEIVLDSYSHPIETVNHESKLAVVGSYEEYGVINFDKKEILQRRYDNIKFIGNSSEYFIVKIGEKWGVINDKVEVKIPFKYTLAYDNYKNFGVIGEYDEEYYGENNKLFLVNEKAEIVNASPYNEIEELEGLEILKVRKYMENTSLYGVVNIEGKETVPVEYSDIYKMKNGSIVLQKGDYDTGYLYGLADENGNLLADVIYTEMEEGKDNKMIVQTQDEKWGYLDKEGKFTETLEAMAEYYKKMGY